MAEECHKYIYEIKIFLNWKCKINTKKESKKVDNISATNFMITGLSITAQSDYTDCVTINLTETNIKNCWRLYSKIKTLERTVLKLL